jgi:Mrp family chromosome partitioning ATPase
MMSNPQETGKATTIERAEALSKKTGKTTTIERAEALLAKNRTPRPVETGPRNEVSGERAEARYARADQVPTSGSEAPQATLPETRLETRPIRNPIYSDKITYTQTRVSEIETKALRKRRIVADDSNSPVADAYRILRTRTLQKMRQNGWNSLGITAPTEGCGSTLTAINLAISMAQDVNHTVLLVDLNLRDPSVHKHFGETGSPGLSDYLVNNQVPELLFNPGIDRLVVLPGNQPIAASSEYLTSPRMIELIREIKSRYDSRIVIFDLPPLLASDDVMVVAPHIDALMLVARDGLTKKHDLMRAQEMLKGHNVVGTMLNAAR